MGIPIRLVLVDLHVRVGDRLDFGPRWVFLQVERLAPRSTLDLKTLLVQALDLEGSPNEKWFGTE